MLYIQNFHDTHLHNMFSPLSGDQLVLYYGFSHRSVKWWKRVFFHLLDVSLVNAQIVFKTATHSNISQLEYRIAVAQGLLEDFQRHHLPEPAAMLPGRLTERAFPEPLPDGKRADCKVCSNRAVGERHQTKYRCKLCHTPLCIYPCFEKYHTLKDYHKKY